MPYKENVYYWEVFNAGIKFGMVATTMMAQTKNVLLIVHTSLIALVFLTSLIIRPYRNSIGNKIVILFCCCNLFGILAQWFESGSDEENIVQTLYILSLMVTIVIFFKAGVKGMNQMAR